MRVLLKNSYTAEIELKYQGSFIPKLKSSSMFPEGWSLQRIQEEVALVYENTFLKRIGFDKTLKTKEGFITHKYIGKSLSEFDILLDINESGKIINARPII